MSLKVLYSKAYKLKQMKCFAGWGEIFDEATESFREMEKLRDDNFVFLHQDYSVTIGPMLGSGVIYDNINPQWKQFCDEILQFKVNLT